MEIGKPVSRVSKTVSCKKKTKGNILIVSLLYMFSNN